jgi:hypothetical protein
MSTEEAVGGTSAASSLAAERDAPSAEVSAQPSTKRTYPAPAETTTQFGPNGFRFDFNDGARVLLSEGPQHPRADDLVTLTDINYSLREQVVSLLLELAILRERMEAQTLERQNDRSNGFSAHQERGSKKGG